MVMNINEADLLYYAKSTGFRAEMLEKVIWLTELLNEIFSDTYLKQRLALKGGTALNLFHFGLPRLSVDIDLNYIGALERDIMLAEREEVEAILSGLCKRAGLSVKRTPSEHAGGKWRLTYGSKTQSSGNLEIDLAYLYRIPLWSTTLQNSHQIGHYQAQQIPLLDLHELMAGKLAALMSRRASRDLYDVYHLSSNSLLHQQLDIPCLRLAFIVYGAMNRHDWRKLKIEDIDFDSKELKNNLLPVLNQQYSQQMSNLNQWAEQLISGCKNILSHLLPFTQKEQDFLELVLQKGEIEPSLITADINLQQKISSHPGLLWKVTHVRNFKGKKG
jgi:predicted nucleotidyltransferase component of viral defense system